MRGKGSKQRRPGRKTALDPQNLRVDLKRREGKSRERAKEKEGSKPFFEVP